MAYKVTIQKFNFEGRDWTKEEAEADQELLAHLAEIGASFVEVDESDGPQVAAEKVNPLAGAPDGMYMLTESEEIHQIEIAGGKVIKYHAGYTEPSTEKSQDDLGTEAKTKEQVPFVPEGKRKDVAE